MEKVDIWYLTDYDDGRAFVRTLETVGFTAHLVDSGDFSKVKMAESSVHIFVVDSGFLSVDRVVSILHDDERLQNYQKFIIVPSDRIEQAVAASGNILHLDFISRPINKREFLILLEKAVVVEKYREMMKLISKEAEGRVEAFESLVHIHKKEMFESDKEKEVFDQIVAFEKKLLDEQKKLNDAIREFTALRQKELFDLKSRIHAEELLDSLRRSEMLDAQETIRAQQAVLEFSTKELSTANTIIKAAEITGELSREEALRLHEELKSERMKNDQLIKQVDALKKQLGAVK
jgi:hypothetical protein